MTRPASQRDTRPWSDCPIVEILPAPTARCPHCGRSGAIIVRSLAGGDGSVCRRSVCRHCSARYLVVVEPVLPVAGNLEDDLSYS